MVAAAVPPRSFQPFEELAHGPYRHRGGELIGDVLERLVGEDVRGLQARQRRGRKLRRGEDTLPLHELQEVAGVHPCDVRHVTVVLEDEPNLITTSPDLVSDRCEVFEARLLTEHIRASQDARVLARQRGQKHSLVRLGVEGATDPKESVVVDDPGELSDQLIPATSFPTLELPDGVLELAHVEPLDARGVQARLPRALEAYPLVVMGDEPTDYEYPRGPPLGIVALVKMRGEHATIVDSFVARRKPSSAPRSEPVLSSVGQLCSPARQALALPTKMKFTGNGSPIEKSLWMLQFDQVARDVPEIDGPRPDEQSMRRPMRSDLRLTDLQRRARSASKLMNVKIPGDVSDAIGRVARALGVAKTDVVIALLNEGLDRSVVSLKGWRRQKIIAPPPKRTCSVKGCGRAYVAKGLCSNHYQAARRVVKL